MIDMASILMGAIETQPKSNLIIEYFEKTVPLVFMSIELTWWKAIFVFWFNILVRFMWTFMNLFLMVVSIGLASQFKQINIDLQKNKGQVKIFYRYFS